MAIAECHLYGEWGAQHPLVANSLFLLLPPCWCEFWNLLDPNPDYSALRPSSYLLVATLHAYSPRITLDLPTGPLRVRILL